MTARLALLSVFIAFAAGGLAAEPTQPEEKALTPKEALKARMRADGKKQPPVPAKTAATTAATEAQPAAKDTKAPAAKTEKPADTPPTVLPKMEVRKSRVTELDQKIARQERDIAREKQATKSTEVDKALNDPKAAKALSIFGGESSQHRETVASERVNLMEAEKDILEAMKTARTQEERTVLQKQLDELKAVRRELEKSLR